MLIMIAIIIMIIMITFGELAIVEIPDLS